MRTEEVIIIIRKELDKRDEKIELLKEHIQEIEDLENGGSVFFLTATEKVCYQSPGNLIDKEMMEAISDYLETHTPQQLIKRLS